MKNMTRNLALWLAGAALAYSAAAIAQDKPAGYPTKPIRLVVAVAAGAGADAIARAVGQMLTDKWGQNAVVDNRPGGGGVLATRLVAESVADGYTILSQGETVLLQGALKRIPFEPLTALDPIVGTSMQPYILLANLSLPVKSIKEMIEYSKTTMLNYAGSSGIGSPVHLGMERLAQLSGAKLQYVAYKGSAPAIIAVIGGEIHMAAASSIAASAAIRTGKVRALATMGLNRLPSMPDLPTVAEQGFPGFYSTAWIAAVAPAKTPERIVRRISEALVAFLRAAVELFDFRGERGEHRLQLLA